MNEIILAPSELDYKPKKCPRCFYLKTNRGFISPSIPGFTLNALTDTLLKKEFDICRNKQVPHHILIKNNLSHIVPYKTKKIKDNNGNEKSLIDVWGFFNK